jgi:hypothetical protein
LCDGLKRRLPRPPRLNLLGANTSIDLRGTMPAAELYISNTILKASTCLRVALVLPSLAKSVGNGKCVVASLSLVCLASLVHRMDQCVPSDIPNSTSMLRSTTHSESTDRRLVIQVSPYLRSRHLCARASEKDLTMKRLLYSHLTLIQLRAHRFHRQLDTDRRNTQQIGSRIREV